MIAHIYREKDGKIREQSVFDHLKGVALVARRLGTPVNMGYLSYLAAIFHDVGKWRKKFNDYLRAANIDEKSVSRGDVNHSSAGAIYLYRRYYKGSCLDKETAQLLSSVILSHHGLNDCISPEGVNQFSRRIEDMESLDYEEVVENFENSSISRENLNYYFSEAVKEVKTFLEKIDEHKQSHSFGLSMMQRLLLSILIDADRLDTAIFIGSRMKTVLKDPSWNDFSLNLKREIEKLQNETEISKIRKKISDECLNFAKRPPGIYRLAVPTGGAKTLSSMGFALDHLRIHSKKRIFYIAPYLSILEQNSQVFKKAIGNANPEYILEHHSNIVFQDTDKEASTGYENYKHLTENWDAPIIISTFVQFLDTLFSDSTQSVRRFHNLTDAVIIIDEIQSLPIQMIYIFNMAINFLSEICHSTIVLSSATQPILDKVKLSLHLSEKPDMIEEVDQLYKELKRVRVEALTEQFEVAGVRSFVSKLMMNHENILIILNTKAAAKLLYQELSDYYKQTNDNVLLFHLSTNLCAQHRLNQINSITERLGEQPLICVSTSLIEAGVDLSFGCVIRSFAGLDSVAQAAGRCNRHGEREEGVVYLINLKEEKLGHLDQVRKGGQCSQTVVSIFNKNPKLYKDDLLSRVALEEFYKRYYHDHDQQKLMDYPLPKWGTSIVDLLCENRAGRKAFIEHNGKNRFIDLKMAQGFKSAGKAFEVINQETIGVLVPYKEGKKIIEELNSEIYGDEIFRLLRKAQRYTVNIYKNQIVELTRLGAISELNTGNALALKEGYYDEEALGLSNDGIQTFLEI